MSKTTLLIDADVLAFEASVVAEGTDRDWETVSMSSM